MALQNSTLVGLVLSLVTAAPSIAGINEWSPLGPLGGYIRAIAIDPVSPSIVYAGLDFGGPLKSSDGGNSWSRINNGLKGQSISCLAIDPGDPRVLFAGTNNGLFKTTDGGGVWSRSDTGLPGPRIIVHSLALDPSLADRLFAGTNDGVFRTLNGGVSWSLLGLQGSNVTALATSRVSPFLYAGTSFDGIYRYDGVTWLHGTQGLTNPQVRSIAVDPFNPMVLYAGCAGINPERYPGVLFKSTNGGISWRRADEGLGKGTVFTVVHDPISPSTLYVGTFGEDVYKSVDGGMTWLPAGNGLDTNLVQSLAVHPTLPFIVYAGAHGGGTAGGIFRSDNAAQSWRSLNAGGILGSWVRGIVVDPDQPSTIYVSTLNEGHFRSRNRGLNWEPFNEGMEPGGVFGSPGQRSFLVRDSETPFNLYTGTNAGIYKSTNHESWTVINDGLLRPNYIPSIEAFAIDPNDSRRLFAGVINDIEAVYRSLDGGQNWQKTSAGVPGDAINYDLEVDPSNPETIYTSTSLGIFETQNSGVFWSPLAGPGGSVTTDLTFHPTNPQEIFAKTIEGLYRSVDRGRTWSRFAESLGGGGYVQHLLIDPRNLSFYAAIGDRVFRSRDLGQSWADLGPGLPNGNQDLLLTLDPSDPARLYAGGEGGIYALQQVEQGTGCATSDVSLCLAGDRFRVEATWETPDGSSGTARVVELTQDTGYLWFFDDSNVESVVKILNGCQVNGRFWVFAGGLTNIQAVIRVTDTRTGQSRTYTNPQGAAFAPIQDTAAFADCP